MKKSYPMHCLFPSNIGDVKMMPFMSYITNIMRILGRKIFYRKLKINYMSIRPSKVEYIMTQKDHKCRYQKCDFHLSIPLGFSLEFSCLTHYNNTRCKEYFADLIWQNACLEHMQKMQKLITNFKWFIVNKSRWC